LSLFIVRILSLFFFFQAVLYPPNADKSYYHILLMDGWVS